VHAQSTSVPAVGLWLKVIPLVPLQLSLALTPANDIGHRRQAVGAALTLVGAGQITSAPSRRSP